MDTNAQNRNILKTGTTTVGVITKDGVVMGADMRATMGHLIAHKSTQKLFKIDEHIAMTIAGGVGDAQVLVRMMQAETDLYKLRRGTEISVQSAATLMANILNQNKFTPYYVQLLIGGVDHTGAHIFSLDPAGGSIPDNFVTTGSGSVFVYGVLEDRWKADMTMQEGVDLVVRGLAAAMKRDSASGDGMMVCTITRDEGYVQLTPDEIAARRKKIGV